MRLRLRNADSAVRGPGETERMRYRSSPLHGGTLLGPTTADPACRANHLPSVLWRAASRPGVTAYGSGPITIESDCGYQIRPMPSLVHIKPARRISPEENARRSQQAHRASVSRLVRAFHRAEWESVWAMFGDAATLPDNPKADIYRGKRPEVEDLEDEG